MVKSTLATRKRSPTAGTRPRVGRTAQTPQQNAGMRSEPPMSFPWAMGPKPAARATAAPPDDPRRSAAESEVLEELRAADTDRLAPLDALNRIAAWRKRLREQDPPQEKN